MSIYPAWVTVLKHPPYFMSLNPHSTRVIMPISQRKKLRLKGEKRLPGITQSIVGPRPFICQPTSYSYLESRISQKQEQWVSENQPLTNTPARFIYNKYGAHTCKYLVNWENYTKSNLNLKWPNWGSFDIPKLVLLHAQLEKLAML